MTRVLRPRTVLAVQNLERSRHYYVDVLGFTEDDITAPGWAFLSKDAFHVMLGECPDEIAAGDTGNHSWFIHLLVDDVDAYYAELRAKGALLVNTPTNREYGLREFILTTPDGHRLMIAQEIP
jgi:catechol 2,3-dioxygenase-like lactoylglutathione lyase family enzyme